MSCLQLFIDICSMSKSDLAFDLRIFYFVPKSDCNISMIVSQTTVKLYSKIEIISSSQSRIQYQKIWPKVPKTIILSNKIRSDFFSVGFYIFEVFCTLLNSRRRLEGRTNRKRECIRSKRVDNHLCLRVLSMLNSKINRGTQRQFSENIC